MTCGKAVSQGMEAVVEQGVCRSSSDSTKELSLPTIDGDDAKD